MVLALSLAAVPAGQESAARYADKEGGFSLVPPAGWGRVEAATVAVPGTLRAGWSPDTSASILVFTSRVAEPIDAGFLLAQHQGAARRTAGAEVREQRVTEIAGMRAMSFILTAPGTGGAIDSSGAEPTTQHWIAIPHQRDILFLLLTAPARGFSAAEATFQALLATLQLTGAQTPDQSLPR